MARLTVDYDIPQLIREARRLLRLMDKDSGMKPDSYSASEVLRLALGVFIEDMGAQLDVG